MIHAVLSLGILALLGDINLGEIGDRLYNVKTLYRWKYPLPIEKYNQHTLAVFTSKFTPAQRMKQFNALKMNIFKGLENNGLNKGKSVKQQKKKKSNLHKSRKSKKG